MKRDKEGFGEMNVSKADAVVPVMSQHWEHPADGFKVDF